MSKYSKLVDRGRRVVEDPKVVYTQAFVLDLVQPLKSRLNLLRRRIRYNIRMAIGWPTL